VGCQPGEFLIRFEVDVTESASNSIPSTHPALPQTSADETLPTVEDASQNSVFLAEIPIREKLTVLQLKEKLFLEWESLKGGKTNIPPLPSPNHIRIRDGKVISIYYANVFRIIFMGYFTSQVGSQSGPLRDERSLSRCLLGLSDGRKLVIQVKHTASCQRER
jgi:hypothetical protein